MTEMDQKIRIEVVYALPEMQQVIALSVPLGANVGDAISRSGICKKHPEIDWSINKLGIYAKSAKLDTVLRDRDRVEIYRPLLADPKAVRKKRADGEKVLKKSDTEATD